MSPLLKIAEQSLSTWSVRLGTDLNSKTHEQKSGALTIYIRNLLCFIRQDNRFLVFLGKGLRIEDPRTVFWA